MNFAEFSATEFRRADFAVCLPLSFRRFERAALAYISRLRSFHFGQSRRQAGLRHALRAGFLSGRSPPDVTTLGGLTPLTASSILMSFY